MSTVLAKSALENAIYSGVVRHQRYVDAKHAFEYRVFSLWLRVSEIDRSDFSWPLIGRRKFGLISIVANDYMAHRTEASLELRLRGEIKSKLGQDWTGQAFMLAQPRHFGFVMNPLALFYCYDDAGSLRFVVGEITNTPWGERFCYVFDMGARADQRPQKFEFQKQFHVSPFLPMDMTYTWMLTPPSDQLVVGIWNRSANGVDFEAHMNLKRSGLSLGNILKLMIKMPLMTWKIWFGIYFNAGILYAIKRVTFYSHPTKGGSSAGEGSP